MKKFLISIIVILILVLIGQLIYFNTTKKKLADNNTITNKVENEVKDVKRIEGEKTTITEVVVPNKIDVLSRTYKGDLKLVPLEKELYKFVHDSIKKIYNETTGKSQNKILQIYDLKEEQINEMNIYSAEDFKGISAETLKVGGVQNINYAYSAIDMESYKENENGYATFNITFTYSNSSEVKIKVYLANSSTTVPNIKFGKQDE